VTFPTGAGTLTVTANLSKKGEIGGSLGDKLIESLTFKATGAPAWT